MPVELYLQALPPEQRQLFERMIRWPWLGEFYMAGGTALALQIGHRQSIDFDFFIEKPFDVQKTIRTLTEQGAFDLLNEDQDTINGSLDGVKVSFFKYQYPLLKDIGVHQTIRIAHRLDIALMKLEAIAGRGSKKDFVDLYFLLKEYTVEQLLENYTQKYSAGTGNRYHLFKSLTYFEDAERQPMPLLIKTVAWDEIKRVIGAEVRKCAGL
jgi:hypothetical protein